MKRRGFCSVGVESTIRSAWRLFDAYSLRVTYYDGQAISEWGFIHA